MDGQLSYGNIDKIGDDETPASAADVGIGAAVVQVDTGTRHTCAFLDTGAVRCWGKGVREDIGDDEAPATQADVDIGGAVTQLSSNTFHTCVHGLRRTSTAKRAWPQAVVCRSRRHQVAGSGCR